MNAAEILVDLDKIKKIVESWGNASNINTLERDLVLDKLKVVYEEVLFADLSTSVDTEKVADIEQIDLSGEIDRAIDLSFEQQVAPQPEQPVEQPIEPETEMIEFVVQQQAIPSVDEERIEVVNQSLFTEDAVPAQQKIDRRVILSLYGDDPQELPKPRLEQPQVVKQETNTPQITTVDKPHTAVLGEVIGGTAHTLGDSVFTVTDKVDVATKVITDQSTSLRKMIGINDKFLMIRDLFAGDATVYEQAVVALEDFDDLDDAMIYIHETYAWNPNSEGVKLLVELLTRKLS